MSSKSTVAVTVFVKLPGDPVSASVTFNIPDGKTTLLEPCVYTKLLEFCDDTKELGYKLLWQGEQELDNLYKTDLMRD